MIFYTSKPRPDGAELVKSLNSENDLYKIFLSKDGVRNNKGQYICNWLDVDVREIPNTNGHTTELIVNEPALCDSMISFYKLYMDRSGSIYSKLSGDKELYRKTNIKAIIHTALVTIGITDKVSTLASAVTESLYNQLIAKGADFFDLISGEDVKIEKKEFLIKPYFPTGKITLVQAESGVGKTRFMVGIMCHVMTGKPLFGIPVKQGKVGIYSLEDDASDYAEMFDYAGMDRKNWFIISNDEPITFQDIDLIENHIKRHNLKLIIFDPYQNFIGSGVDMFKANETRPILSQLSAMAKKNDCAVVIICHTGKDAKGKSAVYRSLGSVDLPAIARSVIQIAECPDSTQGIGDAKTCIAMHVKASSTAKGKSIKYRINIEDENGQGGGSVSFLELTDDTDASINGSTEQGRTPDADAVMIVLENLIKDNPDGVFISWKDFHRCADESGITIPYHKALTNTVNSLSRFILNMGYVVIAGSHHKDYGKPYTYNGVRTNPSKTTQERGVSIRKKIVLTN